MNRLLTKTGDVMHVSECNENDVTFGIISIQLKTTFRHPHDVEAMLAKLFDQLQPIFLIEHTAGIDVIRDTRNSNPVFTDYWQDGERTDWKIKGWTNGAIINVCYIKNISKVPVAIEDQFFNPALFGAS